MLAVETWHQTVRSVFATTYPLEDLFSPDILQSAVQILDSLDNVVYLLLVAAFDLARLANSQVQMEFCAAEVVSGGEPAWIMTVGRGGKANLVFTRFGSGKCKASGTCSFLIDDTVVVVECFLQ